MKRKKKAVQKLVPFKLILADVNRNKTDPELSDRIVILPPCSICRKPITDFDCALIFTRSTKGTRGPKVRRIGAIGEDEYPLLHNPAKLFVRHIECCTRSEANGSLTMFFAKKLSSVLKTDQRDERDLAVEEVY